jgi:hypothetical protein
MNIYINDNIIETDNITDKKSLLEIVDSKLDDEIIEKIYFDEVEVSLNYFQENEIKLEKLNKIKFQTKELSLLIEETLKEAEKYLPKLKKALKNSAFMFKNKEEQRASGLLDKTLEGIEWYLEVINGIISLTDNEELQDQGNKILSSFTQSLNRAMVALQNKHYNYLGDILEVEMLEYLNKLSDFNKKLLK